ncbi:hypothetical protein CU097_000238, partial [Rhizopus azygosporus]
TAPTNSRKLPVFFLTNPQLSQPGRSLVSEPQWRLNMSVPRKQSHPVAPPSVFREGTDATATAWPVRASAEMNQHTYTRASPSTPVDRTEAQAHTGESCFYDRLKNEKGMKETPNPSISKAKEHAGSTPASRDSSKSFQDAYQIFRLVTAPSPTRSVSLELIPGVAPDPWPQITATAPRT